MSNEWEDDSFCDGVYFKYEENEKKLIWVPASFVCYALICSLIYVKAFLSRAHNLHLTLLPKKCTKTEELVLKICLKDMD